MHSFIRQTGIAADAPSGTCRWRRCCLSGRTGRRSSHHACGVVRMDCSQQSLRMFVAPKSALTFLLSSLLAAPSASVLNLGGGTPGQPESREGLWVSCDCLLEAVGLTHCDCGDMTMPVLPGAFGLAHNCAQHSHASRPRGMPQFTRHPHALFATNAL